MLEKVSKYHSDWLRIAKSFLNNKEDAEDIVQDLYLTLHRYDIKEDKIRYKDEINRGFIFIVLRNLIKNFVRDRSRQKRDTRLNISLDGLGFTLVDEQITEDDIFERIQEEVDTWSHYDKRLFELYMYSGLSLRELSKGSKKNLDKFINKNFKLHPESIKRGTGISVTSMFHTIKSCKEKIKLKLNYEL